MKKLLYTISRLTGWLMVCLLAFVVVSWPRASWAHPMPHSMVLLNIHADRIDADLQIPLVELQAAIGQAVNDSSDRLVERLGPQLRAYLAGHIRPYTPDGQPWQVTVGALSVHQTRNLTNGVYRELVAHVQLMPPAGAVSSGGNVRQFVFKYDVVVHQVITHKVLVALRQDWARGVVAEESPVNVGVIELDIVNNTIHPLPINLESGSAWTGFRAMVSLGMQHIAEGTDHLLFLLVLLLPATLIAVPNRWGQFGGVRYSLIRLLTIVTAFTLGHSLTLLAGTLGWLRLPSQPIEVLIAVSILVSALHTLRPLFPGRESWVAAGFGLVHGLAFADILTNLHLDAGPMALSLLGFNLGIELMQVGIITLVIPWLLLLSQTPDYGWLRRVGAVFAVVSAGAWVIERVSGQANIITIAVEVVAAQAGWLLAALALWALVSWWRARKINWRATA